MDSNLRYRIEKQPFLAPPVRSPQFAFRNKSRLFRARDQWFESISLQRRVRSELRIASDKAERGRRGGFAWRSSRRRDCHVDDGGGVDDVGGGVAEGRDDTHGEHEQRERHDRVGGAADGTLGPAAEVPRREAGQCADRKGQHDRGEGDAEIEPRCCNDAAEDVAPNRIGAAPMPGRGGRQRVHRVGGEGGNRRGDAVNDWIIVVVRGISHRVPRNPAYYSS
jgi:hypothetical protein